MTHDDTADGLRTAADQVDALIATVDGINGAAGQRVDDPQLREILRQQAAGEITGDEARERGLQIIERR